LHQVLRLVVSPDETVDEPEDHAGVAPEERFTRPCFARPGSHDQGRVRGRRRASLGLRSPCHIDKVPRTPISVRVDEPPASRERYPSRVARLPILAAAALSLGACAPATLDVLEPGDSGPTDATVDGPRDGAPSTDSPEDQIASPDGASCRGLAVGATCAASADCCSGWCAESIPGVKVCAPTVGCLGVGSACSLAGECCSLACVPGDDGNQRTCGDLPTCSVAGGSCASGADCCSGVCMGGQCPPPPGCRPAGEACGGNGDCCGQLCTDGRCALLSGCRVKGDLCGASFDCCSSTCVLDMQGVGRCAPPPPCMTNDRMPCNAQVGDVCGGDGDCCSRDCELESDGVHRCVPLGGCQTECMLCVSGADCCSGVCSGPDTGPSTCQPAASTCGAEGEICAANPDCCPGLTCPGGFSPTNPVRCEKAPADAACEPDGTACAIPAECCGGHCLVGPSGALVCGSMCVADGAACTSDGDCCATGSSCQAVYGSEVCAPLTP
jgi:hypothetical protein